MGTQEENNIFMYGNSMPEDPSLTRIFPFIMSKLWDYFSFKDSRFSVTKSKEKTARISLFRELNIPCIYTMEASFWGADQGEYANIHFREEHLMNIGRKLISALIIYCKIDPYEVVYGKQLIAEITNPADSLALDFDDIIGEFKENEGELIKDTDAWSSDTCVDRTVNGLPGKYNPVFSFLPLLPNLKYNHFDCFYRSNYNNDLQKITCLSYFILLQLKL